MLYVTYRFVCLIDLIEGAGHSELEPAVKPKNHGSNSGSGPSQLCDFEHVILFLQTCFLICKIDLTMPNLEDCYEEKLKLCLRNTYTVAGLW